MTYCNREKYFNKGKSTLTSFFLKNGLISFLKQSKTGGVKYFTRGVKYFTRHNKNKQSTLQKRKVLCLIERIGQSILTIIFCSKY